MRLFLTAWAGILVLSACATPTPSPTPLPPTMRGAGSSVLAPLWPQLHEGFEKSRGETVVWDWTPLASSQALRELDQGLLDFALIRAVTAEDHYPQLRFTPLATDTLALIVSPTLDLDTLSTAQIQGILRGTVQNWQDFGLEMEPIRLVIRDQDSGAFALLTQVWMPDHPITLAARVLPNDAEIVAFVASHPGTVGFASLSAVDDRVKLVAIEGVRPQQATYPLRLPLLLALPPQPSPLLLAWQEWLLSPEAQAIFATKF